MNNHDKWRSFFKYVLKNSKLVLKDNACVKKYACVCCSKTNMLLLSAGFAQTF